MHCFPKTHLLNWLLALILVAACLSACAPAATAPTPSLHLEPCQLGEIAAQCGTLKVYENRATNQGRQIDLKVAVIKAQGLNPAPDPIFYLAGGPGSSAIDDAPYAMLVLKSALQHRDLALVNQRGTGGSNRLTCPRSIKESTGMVPLDDRMVQDLRGCLSHLDGDPAAYATAWGMDDLDDVCAALGYEKINLYGESYGPTAEQVYLQRHGAHVRTMTLEGVTLVDVPMFEQLPRSSQAALDLLLARCQADSACQAAYPNLRAELSAVIARVEQQPVELPLTDPATGQTVKLNRAMLIQGIHSLLLQTPTAVMLPHMIHQLYSGNYSEIAQVVAKYLSAGAPTAVWHIMNSDFIERGTAQGLDTSCLEKEPLPPFQ
jgi:pimeloyl-ACP methyl ester carboxylesterase